MNLEDYVSMCWKTSETSLQMFLQTSVEGHRNFGRLTPPNPSLTPPPQQHKGKNKMEKFMG